MFLVVFLVGVGCYVAFMSIVPEVVIAHITGNTKHKCDTWLLSVLMLAWFAVVAAIICCFTTDGAASMICLGLMPFGARHI